MRPSTLLLCLSGTLHLQAHGHQCDRSSPFEWRVGGRRVSGERRLRSKWKERINLLRQLSAFAGVLGRIAEAADGAR